MRDLPYDFDTPTLMYNLQQPKSSLIFNLKKFVSNINANQFSADPFGIGCDCGNCPFKDFHHGYIVTDDFRIFKDNKKIKFLLKIQNNDN